MVRMEYEQALGHTPLNTPGKKELHPHSDNNNLLFATICVDPFIKQVSELCTSYKKTTVPLAFYAGRSTRACYWLAWR